jgi:hypothetical protein
MSLLQATLSNIELEAEQNSSAVLARQSDIAKLEQIAADIGKFGLMPNAIVAVSNGKCSMFLSCWTQEQADALVAWAQAVGAVLMFGKIEHGVYAIYSYSLRHSGKVFEVRCMASNAELRMPVDEVAA